MNRGSEFQARARAAGMCRRCGSPAATAADGTPRPYCDDCRMKASAEQRRRRARIRMETAPTPDDLRVLLAELRRVAMELGLCVICGAPLGMIRHMTTVPYCTRCAPLGTPARQ